jgi:hypothetical protein
MRIEENKANKMKGGGRVPGSPGGVCQNLRNINKRTTALTFDFDFLQPPQVPSAPKFAKKLPDDYFCTLEKRSK